MKKIIIIILLLVVGTLFMYKTNDYLFNDSIRFRIISNSNSKKDIYIKNLLVSKLSSILFIDGKKENIKKNIENNIENIEYIINETFKENNYKKSYKINYGMNYFPQKQYKNIKFNEGYYESFVIEIGEAKGNNYWCIMYPSLCMINNKKINKNKKNNIKTIFKKMLKK